MPKVTLTFECPEENVEMRQAIDGPRWEHLVWEIDQYLRHMVKHGIFEGNVRGVDVQEFTGDLRSRLYDLMSGLEFSP